MPSAWRAVLTAARGGRGAQAFLFAEDQGGGTYTVRSRGKSCPVPWQKCSVTLQTAATPPWRVDSPRLPRHRCPPHRPHRGGLNRRVQVDVPDGKLSLQLYQTKKLSDVIDAQVPPPSYRGAWGAWGASGCALVGLAGGVRACRGELRPRRDGAVRSSTRLLYGAVLPDRAQLLYTAVLPVRAQLLYTAELLCAADDRGLHDSALRHHPVARAGPAPRRKRGGGRAGGAGAEARGAGQVSDYAYGDKLEFLASTAVLIKDMVHHCETTTTDMQCDVGTFDQYDQMMKALAGYGLAGKITMQDGTRSGKVLAKVDYCKVEPASGVRRARRRGNRQLTAARARGVGGGAGACACPSPY